MIVSIIRLSTHTRMVITDNIIPQMPKIIIPSVLLVIYRYLGIYNVKERNNSLALGTNCKSLEIEGPSSSPKSPFFPSFLQSPPIQEEGEEEGSSADFLSHMSGNLWVFFRR